MNIVILGAGPAGLCAAWNLVQDGHRVIVFEKEAVSGGLAQTFEKDGFRYDLGPHIFHPKRPSIAEFVIKNLGDRLLERRIMLEIYFRGHRINYPLTGVDVLRSLSPWTMMTCGFSFLWRRLGIFFNPSLKDDGTYETWVVNRFGRRFYDIFFGPYTAKTWGFPPSQLSDIVAKKRIAIRSVSELISTALFKRKDSYHPENPRVTRQFYPRSGAGEISDFFVKGIQERGGEIWNSCEVKKVVLDKNQITEICYAKNGQAMTLDFQVEDPKEKWFVLSTLPINELILMMDGQAPPDVQEAARALDFSSMILLYLNLDRPKAFDVGLLYFSEPEFPFNRIYDSRIFSPEMMPEGKNALCVEFTCTYGDETWQLDKETLFENCMRPLEKHNLLKREWVESYHIRQLTHAYPRFRVGYQKRLRNIFDYLKGLDNIVSFGREGLFSYANVDEVMWMAFEIAKELPYRDRISLPMEEILPDYIDF